MHRETKKSPGVAPGAFSNQMRKSSDSLDVPRHKSGKARIAISAPTRRGLVFAGGPGLVMTAQSVSVHHD